MSELTSTNSAIVTGICQKNLIKVGKLSFWNVSVWSIPGENITELANSKFVGLVGRFYDDNSRG